MGLGRKEAHLVAVCGAEDLVVLRVVIVVGLALLPRRGVGLQETLAGIDRGDVLPLLARRLFEQAETAVGVTIVAAHRSMHLGAGVPALRRQLPKAILLLVLPTTWAVRLPVTHLLPSQPGEPVLTEEVRPAVPFIRNKQTGVVMACLQLNQTGIV